MGIQSVRRIVIGIITAIACTAGLNATQASAISDGQSISLCTGVVTAYAETARNLFGQTAGWIDMRYSASCPGTPNRAVWARATNSYAVACVPGDVGCGYARIVRNGFGRPWCYMAAGATSCTTGAAVDIGSTTAYAEGFVEGAVLGGDATTNSLSF